MWVPTAGLQFEPHVLYVVKTNYFLLIPPPPTNAFALTLINFFHKSFDIINTQGIIFY